MKVSFIFPDFTDIYKETFDKLQQYFTGCEMNDIITAYNEVILKALLSNYDNSKDYYMESQTSTDFSIQLITDKQDFLNCITLTQCSSSYECVSDYSSKEGIVAVGSVTFGSQCININEVYDEEDKDTPSSSSVSNKQEPYFDDNNNAAVVITTHYSSCGEPGESYNNSVTLYCYLKNEIKYEEPTVYHYKTETSSTNNTTTSIPWDDDLPF